MNLVLRLLLTLSVHAARHLAGSLNPGTRCSRHGECTSGECYRSKINSIVSACCHKGKYAFYFSQAATMCFHMVGLNGKCKDDNNCQAGFTCLGYRCLRSRKPAKAPCTHHGNCESNACYHAYHSGNDLKFCCNGSNQYCYYGLHRYCLNIVPVGEKCDKGWNFCEQDLTCRNSKCISAQEDAAAITTTPKPISTATLEEVSNSSTSVDSAVESEAVTTETSTTGDVRDHTSSSVPPETSEDVGTTPKDTSASTSDVTTILDHDSGEGAQLTSIDSTISKAAVTATTSTKTKIALDGTCGSTNTICDTGLVCDRSTCKITVNEPCDTSSDQCASGLTCDASSNTCSFDPSSPTRSTSKTHTVTPQPPPVIDVSSCQLNAAFGTHSTCELPTNFDPPDTSKVDAAYEFSNLTEVSIMCGPLPFAQSDQDVLKPTEKDAQPSGGHSVEFVIKGVNASMLRYDEVLQIGGDDTGYISIRVFLVDSDRKYAELNTASQRISGWRHYFLVTNWSAGNLSLTIYVDGKANASKTFQGIPKCASSLVHGTEACMKDGIVGPRTPAQSMRLRKFRIFTYALTAGEVKEQYEAVAWVVPVKQVVEVPSVNPECRVISNTAIKHTILQSLRQLDTLGRSQNARFEAFQKDDIEITKLECTNVTRLVQPALSIQQRKLLIQYTISVQQLASHHLLEALGSTEYRSRFGREASNFASEFEMRSPTIDIPGRFFAAPGNGGECNAWTICTSVPCTCGMQTTNCSNSQFCDIGTETQLRQFVTLDTKNTLKHREQQPAQDSKYCRSRWTSVVYRCAESFWCNEHGHGTSSFNKAADLCVAGSSRVRDRDVATNDANICFGDSMSIQCQSGAVCIEGADSICNLEKNKSILPWILPVCMICCIPVILICLYCMIRNKETKHFPTYLQEALDKGNMNDLTLSPERAAWLDAELDNLSETQDDELMSRSTSPSGDNDVHR